MEDQIWGNAHEYKKSVYIFFDDLDFVIIVISEYLGHLGPAFAAVWRRLGLFPVTREPIL